MIEIDQLGFGYHRSRLFDGLDARMDKPGIHGLFGRNGTGKSTLLKLLSGLLAPNQGRLRVLGCDPRKRQPGFLERLYFLPEEFHLPNLRPDQLGRRLGRFYPRFDALHFSRYLDAFKVPTRQRFETMSLGQKKKATVAFALATMTPLLLLDEPTNGMDIESRMRFRELLAGPEQDGRLMLISTHQAHDLEALLEHIWFIDEGRLLLSADMSLLGQALRVGVAAGEEHLPPEEDLLYKESVGLQWAWVARQQSDAPAAEVQLELLYKALSMNQDAVIEAVQSWNPDPLIQENGS